MKYVTLSFEVPEGYEKQITDLVMLKIEGILSQIILAPTQAKKDEFNTTLLDINSKNNFIKK